MNISWMCRTIIGHTSFSSLQAGVYCCRVDPSPCVSTARCLWFVQVPVQYVEAMRGSSSSSRHHHRNKDAEREIKPATSLRSMHSIIHKHVAALAAQSVRDTAAHRCAFETSSSRNRFGQIPCFPGDSIPLGSTASLIVSTNL